ncbi:zinc finger domain-containing protein [Streptomyces niveus]|uniref:zinc finger domain-containing protein n=1 Tax=Streptomyces niveus TaxID=193462 RepID=UPI00343CC7E2
MTDNDQPGAAPWGHGRPQLRSGEETKRVRAWYRSVVCPRCDAPVGRVCRTAAGHPAERHHARSKAAGSPPYEEWRKEGLFRTSEQAVIPEILRDSDTMRDRFNVDEPLGDAAAIVGHALVHQVGFSLGDELVLDRFDDAARALALARGPVGSADLVTVLAAQVAALASILAGPFGDPEATYTTFVREQTSNARQQQRREAGRSTSE